MRRKHQCITVLQPVSEGFEKERGSIPALPLPSKTAAPRTAPPLFGSQRPHRVDGCGPPRRHESRTERAGGENRTRQSQDERVMALDAVELAREEASAG